ncbi:coiled-coil domain-containing protein 62-like isoform X2 [Watersipora subatra]|uniref:coiled-coil domain-containing protein 62-like isoform X2 n=1 Tax=Watersipora subatra TaxID=2589382 RepID=UPI00355B1093
MDRSRYQQSSMQSTGGPVAHSTPSKSSAKLLRFSDSAPRANEGHDLTDGCAFPPTRFAFRRDLPSSSKNEQHSSVLSEMERDTIVKQRTELQLLIGELRDRDKELNDMVQAHHTEMKAWQEDRCLTQSMEQKCVKLERDLNKRNNQIRELLKKFKAVEGEALDSSSALETSRSQLLGLEDEHKTVCEQLRELEEYNSKLQDSFRHTSQSLGDAQSKVVQLQHTLQVKDKEAVATSKEVTDLASRLQSLEFSYKQLEKITLEVKTSANDWKNKYLDAKQIADTIKTEVEITTATLEEKDEELEKVRRLLKEKQEELAYTVERERRKDQMLSLQKSKQERTDTELHSLRQIYDLQQHKLAASRKELCEVKEKGIKYRCNINQEESSLFDTSANESVDLTPRSPRKSQHSPRRLSPSADMRSAEALTDDVVTMRPGSSTDRLQKLLNDSKRLVDTITNNESKSPTHLLAQLSMSTEDG